MKFHHIGVAVKSIDTTAVLYLQGGYKRSATIVDPVQNVNICWLTKDEMPTVELLAPLDATSPVCKFLEKNKVALYHICYVVEDLEAAIADLRRMRYMVVCEPVEAPAINNSRIAFLFHKNMGLIELAEVPAELSM